MVLTEKNRANWVTRKKGGPKIQIFAKEEILNEDLKGVESKFDI